MPLIDKKKFLKKFSTRRDAIAAIDFFTEMINSGQYDPNMLIDFKNELIIAEESDIPKQALEFLNEITKSNFRQAGHIERICKVVPKATLDQFKSIILFKWEKWGGDPLMSQYLTPATLFGSVNKFKTYLDEATNHWINKAKLEAAKGMQGR